MTAVVRGLVALALLALSPAGAAAQAPILADLEVVAVSYHTDPTQLDRVREGLERAVATDPHPANWIGLARVVVPVG